MIRDYWVYQQRQNTGAQWALYIVKGYRRNHPEDTTLDITVYSEDIDNPTNSKSFVNWHYDYADKYVASLVTELRAFTDVQEQDIQQLRRSIANILID